METAKASISSRERSAIRSSWSTAGSRRSECTRSSKVLISARSVSPSRTATLITRVADSMESSSGSSARISHPLATAAAGGTASSRPSPSGALAAA
jgi:hypothetical protein